MWRRAIIHKVAVSREPVDLALFVDDNLLLVANNLPAMAVTSYPVACQLDIIDTHLIGRYQLPTNQVDSGWMTTNARSIIDLKIPKGKEVWSYDDFNFNFMTK